MKIVIAGGSGFIGRELIRRLLGLKHEVLLLTRNPGALRFRPEGSFSALKWDGRTMLGEWAGSLDGADAVINLSGENISSKRWSRSQKKLLLESRTGPTGALVEAVMMAGKKPSLLINASAVGFYGAIGEGEVGENDPHGSDFLSDLSLRWEEKALEAGKAGLRVVLLRIGVVLDPSGGALKKMILPFRLFVGGPLGSGRQPFPWIDREDVINIILFALENRDLSGPVNVVSPHHVSMNDFALSLGKAVGRPSWLKVPPFMLKLLLGEMSEMLLGGRKIAPRKLLEAGFSFRYPDLDGSLNHLLKGKYK